MTTFLSRVLSVFSKKSSTDLLDDESFERGIKSIDIDESVMADSIFPPDFDRALFLRDMCNRYMACNGAWNANNVASLEVFLSDSLFKKTIEMRGRKDKEDIEISALNADVIYSDYDGVSAKITVKFSGHFHDKILGIKGDIEEKWFVEKSYVIEDALWLVIGIQTNI